MIIISWNKFKFVMCCLYTTKFYKIQNFSNVAFFLLRQHWKSGKFEKNWQKEGKRDLFCFFVIKMVKITLPYYSVIYKQLYTYKEDFFLFQQKILIFRDFRVISIHLLILAFYIRIQGEIIPFQGPVKTLNINKMAVSGCITLKFVISGLYMIKFGKTIFFFKTNFLAPHRPKIEKSCDFLQKMKKTPFFNQNCQK